MERWFGVAVNRAHAVSLISPWLIVAGLCGCAMKAADVGADMKKVTGTIDYRERVVLPEDAVLSVRLEDVSLQETAAIIVSEVTFAPQGEAPIPFAIEYDPQSLDDRHDYAIRATIARGDRLLFVTDSAPRVLTDGHGDRVDLVLVRSGGGEAPTADTALAGTRWMLRSLGGEAIKSSDGGRPPFLQLDGAAPQLDASGHGGCNSFRGTAELSGNSLKLGPLASTRMACPDMQLEARFFRVLDAVRSWQISGSRLALSGTDGELATFEAFAE